LIVVFISYCLGKSSNWLLLFKGYKDGSALYSRIIDIIKFVCETICGENITWMQSFSKLTWSRISDLVIKHFISKAVPHEASKLIEFQDVVRSTTEFENTLRNMMFISHEKRDGKLTQFVDDVEVHFAVRKRNEILVKARHLLVHYDYDNPLVSCFGRFPVFMCKLLSSIV
jgi:centromere/kinetochore protein ZW10